MTQPPILPFPRPSPRVRTATLATLAVFTAAALAVPAFLGVAHQQGAVTAPPPRTVRGLASFLDSPEGITSEAIAQMQALAQGSADAMQQAGAAAVAEYEAAGSEAVQVLAEAQSEGAQHVASMGTPPSTLQQPPPGADAGNVTASPQASSVPGYSVESSSSSGSNGFSAGPASANFTPYDGSASQVKARLALNIPLTGNAGIDSTAVALVRLYVDVKGDVRSTGNSTDDHDQSIEGTWSDSTVGDTTASGEGATWTAAPDGDGAEAAAAHAASLIAKANATLSSVLSGVKANIALQANLTAMVEAEIEATLAAQEQAEAAIDAEAEARVDATFAASAQAEAQAHAAAERHIEVIQQANVAAKQKLHAEATQQVELVTGAAAQAQQQLRQQAAAALEAGTKAAGQIHAAAQAAVQALLRAPGVNNTDASARAQGILSAAATASAAAQAKANATATALFSQAAAVGAQVDVKVKAILALEAKASADLDAKAKVAAKATLRAEAYTTAKIKANAEAQAKAHLRAAAAAKFKLESAAKAHIKVVLKAALGVNAAAQVSFDGSREMGHQVGEHTDVQATRDIQYIWKVAEDYNNSRQLDHEENAQLWRDTASNLVWEKDAVLAIAFTIKNDIEANLDLLLTTHEELVALGQRYL